MDDFFSRNKLDMDQPLLSMVTFIPAFAALVLLMVARGEDLAAQLVCKRVAIFTTVATFIVSLLILAQFDSLNTNFQTVSYTHLTLPTSDLV